MCNLRFPRGEIWPLLSYYITLCHLFWITSDLKSLTSHKWPELSQILWRPFNEQRCLCWTLNTSASQVQQVLLNSSGVLKSVDRLLAFLQVVTTWSAQCLTWEKDSAVYSCQTRRWLCSAPQSCCHLVSFFLFADTKSQTYFSAYVYLRLVLFFLQ